MISRVTIWACPSPDCEEFDTQRWTNRRASEGCAHANHPEAVQVEVIVVEAVLTAALDAAFPSDTEGEPGG